MNELLSKLIVEVMSDPDGAVEEVGGYIEKYKPIAYKALKYFVDIYDDYVEAGFTEDQAMALLLNDNIRLMENIKKASGNASKSRSSK